MTWHGDPAIIDAFRWAVVLASIPLIGMCVAGAVLTPRIAQRLRYAAYALAIFLGASDRLLYLGSDHFTWRLPLYALGIVLGTIGTWGYLTNPGDTNWHHRTRRPL